MGIQWSEGLMIGHPVLDAEHNAIIQKINDFESLIECCTERNFLAQQYADIVDCLSDHFIREEQIMSAAKYPDAERHTTAHGELFSKLSEMTLRIENNDPDIESVILEFLHKWFFGHVMALDKAFVEFLSSHSEAA